MQVLLSEKEYKEMEGKIEILKHYADLFHEMQDKLRDAFLVTCHGREMKDIKVTDIIEDFNKLQSIAIQYGFSEDEKEAIKKYMTENEIKTIV